MGHSSPVAKGNQLYPTAAGEKAGVKMRHLPDGTVCEINGKPAFQIRRSEHAALRMNAELFTNDGAFLKWSEESLSGLLTLKGGEGLQVGGIMLKDCTLRADVGIQIGNPSIPLPTAVG